MTDFPAAERNAFQVFYPMTTRWRDNDVYGHINNAYYYEFFDTAVNQWLLRNNALDLPHGPVVGLVAETACRFLSSVSYPQQLEVGVTTLRVGTSSVIFGLGLFVEKANEAAALCRFVHVYVDQDSRRPTPIPETMKEKLRMFSVDR